MDYLAYAMVLVLVIASSVATLIINRKRAKLDLATQEGKKKDKSFRLVITILAVDTVVLSAVILIFVKPMLSTLSQ